MFIFSHHLLIEWLRASNYLSREIHSLLNNRKSSIYIEYIHIITLEHCIFAK